MYKRKGGRWEAAVYLPTVSGRTRRLRVYGRTRKDAHDRLTAATARVQAGQPIADKTWRLDCYLDHWLTVEKRRPLTMRRHESMVRLYLKPRLGRFQLEQLSVQIVQAFINQLEHDEVPLPTIHQARKVLSSALTYALRQEIIFRNVARLVEMPRYKPKEADHWSADELSRFLEAAKSDPLYPAFVLLALYGLRRGEVLGIRWRDVDFDHGVLRIRQQIQRIDGKLQQVELKTDTSVRDEPLLAVARTALLQQSSTQTAHRTAAGDSWRGCSTADELVFTTRFGTPVESRNLYRSFLRICAANGLRIITIHGLRHTNATTQKSLQVHDRDISAILGHGDVRTTGIYEHVDMDSKRTALEKVQQRLFAGDLGYTRERSRQTSPSIRDFVVKNAISFFGGSSQTRTGDTRLFREAEATLEEQLTSIEVEGRRRIFLQKLGCIAVHLAVKDQPQTEPVASSWRDIELPDRSTREAA
ncbi:tyrosine-type recombinase/integrase [Amycolatopsis sp. NPDC004772]